MSRVCEARKPSSFSAGRITAGSFSDWNEVTQLLSGVHLTDEKKVEIPH